MKFINTQSFCYLGGILLFLSASPGFGQATGMGTGAGSGTTTSTGSASSTQPPAGTATRVSPQTTEPAPSGSMSKIVVNAVPPEENILPTSRPVNSVYGIDLPVLDTPRSATIISREQLSQIDIQDARDYSKLTSDAYTESDFGTPAVPSIRGQPGDVLINGIRTAANADGNGPPVDFNNIESVNIVKGPPSADIGSSEFVGGYVDEVTKRPYFDKFQGDASTTIGMFDQFRQSLDFGGPIIKDQLAYRVSYSGTESGSYYDLVHNDSQTGYMALSWIPTDKYTLDFNASYGEVDYLENNGITRVTQNLIDNGQYAQGQALPVGGGFFNPAPITGTTDISRSTNTHNPNDGAYAQTANAQAIQTLVINDDMKVVSNTFWQYLFWRTLNGQGYDQLTNGDNTADQRLSFIWNADLPVTEATTSGGTSDPKDSKSIQAPKETDPGLTFHNTLNTGLEFRMESHQDYQSFAAEPFNAYDLTANNNDIAVPPSASAGGFPTPYNIPGMPGQYLFQPANSGASTLYESSVYVQDKFDFTNQWSLFFGGRADIDYVDAQNPPGTPTNTGDPNIFAADHTTEVLPDFNVSPTYKPFNWMTIYATLNRGAAPGNTTQSGAFSPSDLSAKQFHEYATMYEFGAKFSLIQDKLFATGTLYREDRYDPATTGGSYKQQINGVEGDLNYQPDKHFYATLSYSYAYSHDIDPGFVHEVNASYTPGQTTITDNPNNFNNLTGTFKSPGFPNHVFNALFVYKFDNGFGVSADAQATSPINVTWVSDVQIPWQYNVDFSAFYDYKQSEVKLSVYNATDQRNFGSVNPIYGLDSIFAAEPIHLEGTLKIHF
jgi:outer membrane receptor protein involved in Fe transport